MKKISTYFSSGLVLALLVTVAACGPAIFDFDVFLEKQEIVIPAYVGQPSSGHIYTWDYAFKSGVQQALDNNKGGGVDDVKLTKIDVAFKSGVKGNLQDIQGVQVYAKKKGASGLGEQVAEANIAEGVTGASLNVTGKSLKFLLDEENVTFTATVFIRNSNSEAVTIELKNIKLMVNSSK